MTSFIIRLKTSFHKPRQDALDLRWFCEWKRTNYEDEDMLVNDGEEGYFVLYKGLNHT